MKYFSINEISKIFGVSKQTLRYYDKIGLLKPGYVDASNNYRYYYYEQFFEMSLIIQLKDLGVSLKEIKEYMQYSKITKLEEVLTVEAKYLDDKINDLKLMQQQIQFVLEKIEKMNSKDIITECYVEYIEERFQYKVEETFEMKDLYNNMRELYTSFINEILEIKGLNKLNRKEVLLTINKNCLLNKDCFKYESIGFLLDLNPREAKLNNGLFTTIDSNYYAITHHLGGYSTIGKSYNKLIDYIEENNYSIIGSSIEKAIISVAHTRDSNNYITEIQIPILLDETI